MITPNTQKPTPRKIDWWMYGVPVIAILALVFYVVMQSRTGLLGLVLFYLAPAAIVFLSVVLLIAGIIHAAIKRPFFNTWRLAAWVSLIALCFIGFIGGKYPSSYDDKPSMVAFRLPTDSAMNVAWGGGDVEHNYHVEYPDQCWAYDLLILKNGLSYAGDSTQLESYHCYGVPVVAPASGKVVGVYGEDPDMPVGSLGGGKDPHGNHLILEVAQGEYLFLCHLQPNSIQVHLGDTVAEGQQLARIGNSGNTSEPHLHVHLQSTKELSFGEGIPMYFHHYTANRNYVDKGIPTGGFDAEGNSTGQTIQHAAKQ